MSHSKQKKAQPNHQPPPLILPSAPFYHQIVRGLHPTDRALILPSAPFYHQIVRSILPAASIQQIVRGLSFYRALHSTTGRLHSFSHTENPSRRHRSGLPGKQERPSRRRHEAQSSRHELPPEVPQGALHGPVLRPLRSHVRAGCRRSSIPIRKDDEVQVVRGTYKGREGKVVQVYRRRWVIHVERITREKVNGSVPG
ncbi:60S ribosomal protein L26-1 [Zea mays]|uniref:60S ribosomal protein L26-1 n=1 Tax=Zea mays TaxID=4577 RepID=A0A3L6GAM8_MAIZE|nr:60S ribosomal protein L26-1 [Zea mays]